MVDKVKTKIRENSKKTKTDSCPYLIPHGVEAVIHNGPGARFKSVRDSGACEVHDHEGVNNLSFLSSSGLGQVTGGDHVDDQADSFAGLRHGVVDHVVRLKHVAGAAVLQELSEVDVVWQVAGLVVQRDQLCASGPGSYGQVVGGVDARALGVDATGATNLSGVRELKKQK